MPAQNRVRRYERCDVAQRPSANPVSEDSEPPPLIIGQTQSAAVQLPLQDPVLFAQEVDDVSLLVLEPSEQRSQNQLKRDHV